MSYYTVELRDQEITVHLKYYYERKGCFRGHPDGWEDDMGVEMDWEIVDDKYKDITDSFNLTNEESDDIEQQMFKQMESR